MYDERIFIFIEDRYFTLQVSRNREHGEIACIWMKRGCELLCTTRYRALGTVWHRCSELDAHTVRVVFCFPAHPHSCCNAELVACYRTVLLAIPGEVGGQGLWGPVRVASCMHRATATWQAPRDRTVLCAMCMRRCWRLYIPIIHSQNR